MNITVEAGGHRYHYPNTPPHMVWPLIDALEEAGFNMDDTKHLARATERIINLEEERGALLALVEQAQPHVCSLLCPSVWKTGEEQTHSPLCVAMSEAIAQEI